MNLLKAVNTVKTIDTIKTQIDNFKMTTQEHAFRRALLKITNNSELNQYFAISINTKLIGEFLKILKELGKYSKKYVELVKKLKINDIDNEEENLYVMEGGSIETQIQKLNNDINVNDFLNDLMIINTPIISQKIAKILKTIGEYKVLKKSLDKTIDKLTIKLEKDDNENIQKHFDELEKHIATAREKIDEILTDSKLKKMNTNEFKNAIPEKSFETASANAPNNESNNISYDFYNALIKIIIKNKNIFSRQLDQKLLTITNSILSQLNDLVNYKIVIESYNGDIKEEEKEKIIKEEDDKMDLNKMKENILRKYENSNFEKKIVETIVKIVENIQNTNIDSYPFKKIVEHLFKKKIKKIEKIIIICNEKNEPNKQECIDDANLLKNEMKEYILEKKVVVVSSAVPSAVSSAPSAVPSAVPSVQSTITTGLLAKEDLIPNLSGILNIGTKELQQGLDSKLQGTIEDVENQFKDVSKIGNQLGSLQENAQSQLQSATNQLGSLQENAQSQLQGAENQLQNASKIGNQLGSQFKDASKIGEQLGSLLKKGGKRKKITRKSSSRAFRKTRRRRQIYR